MEPPCLKQAALFFTFTLVMAGTGAAEAQKATPVLPAATASGTVRLLGIAFTPARVEAGKSVKLNLRLTGRAPAGGFVVKLESADARSLHLPPTITVPPGAAGIGLTLTTRAAARLQVRAASLGDATTWAKDSAAYRAASLTVVGPGKAVAR